MRELSPVEREMLRADLKTRSPSQIARTYGLSLSDILNTPSSGPVFAPVSDDGWGRQELRAYIVSRTKAGAGWPLADLSKIMTARRDYDAGLVEMCTGRDGKFLILYSIPRKQPTDSRPYFFTETTNAG